MSGRSTIIALLALASAGASPAFADDAQSLRAAVYAASSSRAGPTAQTRARLAATQSSGIARTAIDQKISDGLTGSLGFMCGNARAYAPNSPLGYDPAGRFVGAKLGLAF